jgi:hypothetical protein
VAIKPTASTEVRMLVAALIAGDDVQREAAVARLAVIGSRAVNRLVAAYGATGAGVSARIGILRALEAVADARALPVALQALNDRPEVAVAGVGVLRVLLESVAGGRAAQALDTLVTTVLDTSVTRRVRLAALDALTNMPAAARLRIETALKEDPDPVVRSRVGGAGGVSAAEVEWQEAMEGRAGSDPAPLREAAELHAGSAPLIELQRLIDVARERETQAGDSTDGAEWRELRGVLHRALAERGSTVALYDLRETLDRTTVPLPEPYLVALQKVGDEACLEPIAGACSRVEGDARWQEQLAMAFSAIASRYRLSKRSATLKRIGARWPDAALRLNTPSRTRPRPSPGDRT